MFSAITLCDEQKPHRQKYTVLATAFSLSFYLAPCQHKFSYQHHSK